MNRKYVWTCLIGITLVFLGALIGSIFFPIVLVNDQADFTLFGDYGPYTSQSASFYETLKPELIQFIKERGFTEKPYPKWRAKVGVVHLNLQNRKKPYIVLSKRFNDLSEVYLFVQPPCDFATSPDSQSPLGIEVRYIYRYWQFYYSRPQFLKRSPVEMWKLHDEMAKWWIERCKSKPHPFSGGGSGGAACLPSTASQPVHTSP